MEKPAGTDNIQINAAKKGAWEVLTNPGYIKQWIGSANVKMTFLNNIFLKTRHIILYGFLLAVLIFILKWLEWKFLIVNHSLDIYTGLIAVFFTIFGVWLATKWVSPKVRKVVVEKEIYIPRPDEFTINEKELEKLNLSSREYEVLKLLAKGYSNADIAADLFLSVSTIKTHVSNLFVKIDVKSRTQASEKARRLQILE